MIKIENFEFSKMPDFYRSTVERGSSEIIHLAGSLSTIEEFRTLQRIIRSKKIFDFFDDRKRYRVVLKDCNLGTDVIWGFRYELLFIEYNPIDLIRIRKSDGNTENIGEKVFSPRFQIAVKYDDSKDEIKSREIINYEFDIQIKLNSDTERFKVRFEDKNLVEKLRRNFNKWIQSSELSAEVFLGHLEHGYFSVAKGSVTRKKGGITASGNWIEFEGSGKLRQRTQEYVYLLSGGENIVDGSLEQIEQGVLSTNITTILIPDIRPKDDVQVVWDKLDIDITTKLKSIEHEMSLGGALTKITI